MKHLLGFLLTCMCAKWLQSCLALCNPWTAPHQDPLSMGLSRQEYWSRLQCPPPADLPDPGIKLISLTSPASADKFFTTGSTWEALYSYLSNFCFIDDTKAFDCVDHNKLWKILQKMGIPDHLTCLMRNLYAGQEATVRTGHGSTDWFLIGKGMCQCCIWSPCLFNLYA